MTPVIGDRSGHRSVEPVTWASPVTDHWSVVPVGSLVNTTGHRSILPVTGQYYRSQGTSDRSRRDIDIHHRIIHPLLLLQRHLGRQLVPTIYVDVVHDLLYRVTLMHCVDLIDTGPPRL
ncbi:hypothetical protein DPMN_040604 [Dreissena polymorpha]|uniref:Uncharacterized protein n=1 Tax=Dreissena polymorpha TaxID=45954 RepID=A0A9D4CY18_DREPO|nr:hypothetical protein DPMN_040604 [Dreissena polymorpha]